MKQTSDKINNNEEERIKKIYGKIHKNFLENKTERNEIDYLYKKLYLHYINLIENNKLDIQQEIIFIELEINRYDNDALKYFQNIMISFGSGVVGSITSILITDKFENINNYIGGIIIALLFLFIGIIMGFLFKNDITEISKEKRYYSTCLLVLKDLEEELL
ncbi:hypothetical protein [Clostridium perfringens]|uniref:hypothetical protein n=1 Tax=Clostridium perfringens TaxID=1502 RepID=UPI0024BD5A8E|nr:hypothetical protein [Clostridium perfringens]CAJ1869293.1 hypothetical protein AUSP0004_00002 [uncultured phage]